MKAFEDFELHFENLGGEKALNDFPKFYSDLSDSYQICLMIDALNGNYQWTKGEIHQLFTKDETLYIYQSCLNSLYEPLFVFKDVLIANIEDNNVPEFQPYPIVDINVENLIKKVRQLSEFQCFTIYMMIREIHSKTKPGEDFTKIALDTFKPVE